MRALCQSPWILLLPLGRRAPHALVSSARRRPAGMTARNLASSTDDGDFLVRNERNDVQLLQCGNRQLLEQGLLETDELPHICVAGESNAGKSSLINHLLKKKLARASSVAGKTRSVDMLLVNERLVITDLPGLPSRDGQVARIWETEWRPLVMQYVAQCAPLRAMLYVHDIRWKVSPACREFVHRVQVAPHATTSRDAPRCTAETRGRDTRRIVQDAGVPVVLVLTKDDRLAMAVEGSDDTSAPAVHARRRDLTTRIRRAFGFDGAPQHAHALKAASARGQAAQIAARVARRARLTRTASIVRRRAPALQRQLRSAVEPEGAPLGAAAD